MKRTFSPPVHRWAAVSLRGQDAPTLPGLPGLEKVRATHHGQAFRAVRMEFGLGLRETAAAYGVTAVEVSALERGERVFPSADEFWAALRQLREWGREAPPPAVTP